MNLNRAMVLGNLTRDPELKTTPSGQNVVNFGVATNMTWTDQAGEQQQRAEFHNIVAWRKLADICAQYLKKGSKVYIEGRLETTEWKGQDEVKRYKTEIVAENMIMLDSKTNTQNNAEKPSEANSEPVEETETTIPEVKDEDIKVEDIPF